MLKLALILISFIFLGGSSTEKVQPIVILSKKIEMDKIIGVVKYEGPVRIEYKDYSIVTKKMIINTSSDKQPPQIIYIEFPSNATLIKSDNSEIMMLPNAIYIAERGIITADGKITIEKDNQLFSTTHIEIQVGAPKDMVELWQ